MALSAIETGKYQVAPWWQFWKRGGWIEVERVGKGETSLMWTSNRDYHLPLTPATAIDIDASGNMVAYYESAITMWLKWGYGKGGEIERQRGLREARWMANVLRETAKLG